MLLNGYSAGTQLFVGSRPEKCKLLSPENKGSIGIKPTGGMWTSTLLLPESSAWIEWCLAEEFRSHFPCWLAEPKPSNVFRIDSQEDCQILFDTFSFTPHPELAFLKSLDFEKMLALGIDGIHLTGRGQEVTRFMSMETLSRAGLYGWDCESTLWLKWRLRKVRQLGVARANGRELEWREGPFTRAEGTYYYSMRPGRSEEATRWDEI